jgi:hypothetical protein
LRFCEAEMDSNLCLKTVSNKLSTYSDGNQEGSINKHVRPQPRQTTLKCAACVEFEAHLGAEMHAK